MKEQVPIIIPSYEPDERFLTLLENLASFSLGPVVVVNDGSGQQYDHYFNTAEKTYKIKLLRHTANMGKGKALKTAFSYCLQQFPKMVGCITVDSDGQHTVDAIKDVKEQLIKRPDQLVLGVRNFCEANVPAKSQFGNNLTRNVFKVLYKKDISDTQTGLRAIPADFMRDLLSVPGNRFEFETRMLIKAVEEGLEICEVPIETVYDSKENHATHFRPIVDSIRIYRVFGFAFGKFLVSSFSSSLLDLTLFQVFCAFLKNSLLATQYIIVSTVGARIISAMYNYLVNYYFVFKSKENHTKSACRYFVLAILQMACSAALVSVLVAATGAKLELVVKIPVDVFLFFVSYYIQKRMVY